MESPEMVFVINSARIRVINNVTCVGDNLKSILKKTISGVSLILLSVLGGLRPPRAGLMRLLRNVFGNNMPLPVRPQSLGGHNIKTPPHSITTSPPPNSRIRTASVVSVGVSRGYKDQLEETL